MRAIFVGSLLMIGAMMFSPNISFADEKVLNSQETNMYDPFGGWKGITVKATGFFKVEQINGKWWIITPEGNGFISKGVNDFWYRPRESQEGINFLRSLGFNTIGAWSKAFQDKTISQLKMPYAILLDLLKSYATSEGRDRENPPDIFTEEFAESVRKQAEEKVKPFASDPFLIGWWTDNELKWASENPALLDSYLKFRANEPGRKAAEDFLRKRLGSTILPKDIKKLEEARDGFVEIAVRRYAEVTSRAIREYDKNHLILGSRLFFTPLKWKNMMPERMGGFEAVARGAKDYWDIISINCYFEQTPIDRVRTLYESFGKPILISEFNIKSANKDQGKRGETEWLARAKIAVDGLEQQVPSLLAEPSVVGYHYFPYVNYEYPKENRRLPGPMNYRYEPREIFVKTFSKINPQLEEIHKSGGRK